MPRYVRLLSLVLAALWSGPAAAEAMPFRAWLEGVKAEAQARGIRSDTLQAALTGVAPIPRVLELDRRQPESTLSFAQYFERVVSPARIERGRQRYEEHRPLLDDIGRRYGVPPRVIVALWGIETDFGRMTGGFPVVAALATLAHDGRRSTFFRKELLDALQILDEGHIEPAAMQGSWAGAMGQNQFMPSSFRAYAVDHDGDGRRDIWGNLADVFASTANYLSRSGWRSGETWGREVALPAGFDRALVGADARRPLREWAALGLRRADGGDLPQRDIEATLLSGERDGGGPYFLAYENFRVILKWNRSNYFAISVGRLSDAIQAGT